MTDRNVPKSLALTIAADLNAAAAEVFARHGLTVGKGRTTYGDSFRWSIEGFPAVLDDAGINRADPAVRAWEVYAPLDGLPVDALGKTFVGGGGRLFTITGYNPRARSMPVLARCEDDGRNYKLGVEGVKRGLAVASLAAGK